MEKPVELSIITVNYNGLNDTGELIASVRGCLTLPYELIVVDNGSERNEAEILARRFPFIRTIRSERNLGFAGGNNLGILRAKGDCLFFLNNDTLVRDGGVQSLIDWLKNHPEVAGVSPKIKYTDRENRIQYAGSTLLSPVTLRNRQIGYREEDRGQYDVPCPTPYLHGAAMMLRRRIIEEVGLIPECYFLYYEELDWCSRIWDKGYELWYLPAFTLYHKESSSIGTDSPLKTFYLSRNRLLYACRNLRKRERSLALVYQLLIVFPKDTLRYLVRGKFRQALSVGKGVLAFFCISQKS
jgi:GT2 family glycosyltransferase